MPDTRAPALTAVETTARQAIQGERVNKGEFVQCSHCSRDQLIGHPVTIVAQQERREALTIERVLCHACTRDWEWTPTAGVFEVVASAWLAQLCIAQEVWLVVTNVDVIITSPPSEGPSR